MSIMRNIWKKAKSGKKRIVLPEGSEKRTLLAASIIKSEKLADIVLIGNKAKIQTNAIQHSADIRGIEIIDPMTSQKYESYSELYFKIRKDKGITLEQAYETLKDDIYYATLMVKSGDADGMVSGADHPIADLLRPALQIIKTAPGISIVSSSFIMELPYSHFGDNGVLVFADCAVNPDPDAKELASIALAAAATARTLCGMEPRVAMLSFSTKGSASHETIEKVIRATGIAKKINPALIIDGELQVDTAIVPEVASMKAKYSPIGGRANVLIFPDLNSGNIAYKSVQRLAKANAIGPIGQGFDKPVNNLSRGCSVEDIVNVVAITAVQAMG